MKKASKTLHAAISSKPVFNSSFEIPIFFNNPYNDADYDIFEDLWSNVSIINKSIDIVTSYTLGKKFKPILKLRDEKITGREAEKILDTYKDQEMELQKFDDLPKIQLEEKTRDLMRNSLVFGRSTLVFEPNFENIKALKPIHSRDLGRVYTNQSDFGLSSVQIFLQGQLVPVDQMIYAVNERNTPRRRAMHYGFSEIQPVASPGITLRRIFEFDFPEIIETAWADRGILTVDNQLFSQAEKITDLNTIKNNTNPAALNILSGKKDDFQYFSMNPNPKTADIGLIVDKLERTITGHFGIPGAILGREEEANMATMGGKTRIFMNVEIPTRRRWIERILVNQYYLRRLEVIEKGITEKVTVSLDFEKQIIETWVDMVQAAEILKKTIPSIPDEELLRILHLENIIPKLNTAGDILKPENLKQVASNIKDIDSKTKMMNISRGFEQK